MALERFRRIFFSLAALGLLAIGAAGCTAPGSFRELVSTATQTITNPIDKVDLYRVKNTYAAALTLADDYRTYCYARPYITLMADPIAKPICASRRAVLREIQARQPQAKQAIVAAENFVRDNPTLNAATAVSAAWRAVQAFQASVPKTQ